MSVNKLIRFLLNIYPFEIGRSKLLFFAMRRVHGLKLSVDDYGNRLLLDLDNYIDSKLFLEGSYEKESIEALSKMIDRYECRYAVDIGANIGVYTLPIANNPNIRKVYAFEPDPRNFSQLIANVFLNNLYSKIEPSNIALFSKAGSAVLYLSREKKPVHGGKFNTGHNSLTYDKDSHTDTVTIRTEMLDNLIDLENESIVVKIDVEGHEYQVLEGMERLLKRNSCLLQVEAFPDSFDAVDSFLSRFGYVHADPFCPFGSNYMYIKRIARPASRLKI